MTNDYKYDLAISFLQEDEALALDIADRIGDRLSVDVFVYSKRQDELVGREGLEAFSGVFGTQARIVAILHREAWGKTLWTRVEETAIKNRAFEDGFDFLLIIRLDRSPTPNWIPRTQIYLGLEKYRIDGAASAIEAMVLRTGGSVRSESAIDYAGRIARKINFEREKQDWYNSAKGVADASAEARSVLNEITRLGTQMKNEHPSLQLRVDSRANTFMVASNRYGLVMFWDPESVINSLRGSALTAQLYSGFVAFREGFSFAKPPLKIETSVYDPDIDRSFVPGWRERDGEKKFLTSMQLCDLWVKRLLNLIDSPEKVASPLLS